MDFFQRTVVDPTAEQESVKTADFLMSAPEDQIRKWEGVLTRNEELHDKLQRLLGMTFSLLDPLFAGGNQTFAFLEPSADQVPVWAETSLLKGGSLVMGPTDIVSISERHEKMRRPEVSSPDDTSVLSGWLGDIFCSQEEFERRCEIAMQGFRARFGDEIVEEARKGFRFFPRPSGQRDVAVILWKNFKENDLFPAIILTGKAFTQAELKFEDDGLLSHDAVQFWAEEMEDFLRITPVLRYKEGRALVTPNLEALDLSSENRQKLAEQIWCGVTNEDRRDLVQITTDGKKSDLIAQLNEALQTGGTVFFALDIQTASLIVFRNRKDWESALQREPGQFFRSFP